MKEELPVKFIKSKYKALEIKKEKKPEDVYNQIYHELARLFHSDSKGYHEIMTKLNLAKEKCDQGDCRELMEMYKVKNGFEVEI